MNSILKTFAVLSLMFPLFGVVACAPGADQLKLRDEVSEQQIKNEDEIKRLAEQAKSEAATAAEEAKRLAEASEIAAKNAISPGGQPGVLSLAGAVAVEETEVSQVKAVVAVGKSWRGEKPALVPGKIIREEKVSDTVRAEIEKLKDDKNFINMGCQAAQLTEQAVLKDAIKNLDAKQVESPEAETSVIASAKLIVICGSSELKKKNTLLRAQTIVISSAHVLLKAFAESSLILQANKIVLLGDNKLEALAPAAESTLIDAPSIAVSALELTGDGKLEISSRGADFKEAPATSP